MKTLSFAICMSLVMCAFPQAPDGNLQKRRAVLATLTALLPKSKTQISGRINAIDKSWEDWLLRTGELPPDFDAMPSIPELPDPLVLSASGKTTPITARSQWEEQRRRIRAEFEHWVYGKMPPAPGNLRAMDASDRKLGALTERDVRLAFGPGHRGSLRLQLLIPPGAGPFPVFLTNHPRTRPWIAPAVRRGYIACIYFAADPRYGNDDDSDGLIEVYPEYDFSCLARWAWSAMRAVDYLCTLAEVDKSKIGITGHSRNGKQALLAAAFDERIGAVVPSSGNTGEGNPWRFTTEMFQNESLEQITRNFPHWFHPRLRFFTGREHKLPVDQNSLMALIAPRGLMLASAYSEHQGNPWGFEQAYRSVREVYRFLGREENLALYLRPGEHPTTAEDIERYVDFFDRVFGRGAYPREEQWVHGFNFRDWKQLSGEEIHPSSRPERTVGSFLLTPSGRPVAGVEEWAGLKSDIVRRVLWGLGEEPPAAPFPNLNSVGQGGMTSDGWLGLLHGRPLQKQGMGSSPLSFGDDLKGDLYYPLGADDKAKVGRLPAIVWLHPYSYATGYSRYALPSIASLTSRGFAVLAFDQIGFGTRVLQAGNFYLRYPKWSLLGKMVSDTRAAIDALSALETIDPDRIYVFGYALGAKVGLFTAALDERIAGLVAACGFAPLRLAAAEKGTEGIRHYSHLHGLMPRLGFFVGEEARLPFDYDELLALAAPRPIAIIAPTLDRYNPVDDIRRAVHEARKVYGILGRAANLKLETPVDYNRFPSEAQLLSALSAVADR